MRSFYLTLYERTNKNIGCSSHICEGAHCSYMDFLFTSRADSSVSNLELPRRHHSSNVSRTSIVVSWNQHVFPSILKDLNFSLKKTRFDENFTDSIWQLVLQTKTKWLHRSNSTPRDHLIEECYCKTFWQFVKGMQKP